MTVYLNQELILIINRLKSNGSLNPWEMLDHVYGACELLKISLPIKMTGNPGKCVADNINNKVVCDLISQLRGKVHGYASGNHLYWMSQKFFHDKAAQYTIRCSEEIANSIQNSLDSIVQGDQHSSKSHLDDAFCQAASLARAVKQLQNIVNRGFISETIDFMGWIMMHVAASWVLVDGLKSEYEGEHSLHGNQNTDVK